MGPRLLALEALTVIAMRWTLARFRLFSRFTAVSALTAFGMVQLDMHRITRSSRRFETHAIRINDALSKLLPLHQPLGAEPLVARIVGRELSRHFD